MASNRRELDRRTFLQSTLALGAGTLLPAVLRAAGPLRRASVIDFGADPEGKQDATDAVRAAIASLARTEARLVFPSGRYRFAASSEAAMQFSGFAGIEVYANNAELVFNGDTIPFSFRSSKDVAVHDLKIDWQRPAFSQGMVRDAGPQSFTIAVDEAFPVTGAETIIGFAEFEPTTAQPAANGVHARGLTASVQLVQPQRLRITTPAASQLRTGMRLVLLHATAATACFQLESCQNILLEGITIRHAPATAFLMRGCRDLRLDSITIDSPSLLSTGGDGLHCSNGHGKVILKEVRFQGIGGDAINIYQPFWKIIERLDDRTIVIAGASAKTLEQWELPDAGDFIQFSRPSNLQLIGEIGITSLQAHPRGTKLSLSETLSPIIVPGTLVCGVVDAPRITIDQAPITNSLGRGLTLHSRAEITNSNFENCRREAIALAADHTALQGPNVQSVHIRANSFANCAIGKPAHPDDHPGMITIDVPSADPAHTTIPSGSDNTPQPIHSGVRIQGNTFYRGLSPAIFASGVDDLAIDENIFGRAAALFLSGTAASGTAAAIVLRNIANAEITNNRSDTAQTIAMTNCADTVKTENNHQLTTAKLG